MINKCQNKNPFYLILNPKRFHYDIVYVLVFFLKFISPLLRNSFSLVSIFLKCLQKCWGQSSHSIKIHSVMPVVSQGSKFNIEVGFVVMLMVSLNMHFYL